jgi:hypothetical protein
MYQLPTVPNPGSNHHHQQRQQVPPPSPHHLSGPDDSGNWEHRWRRKTTYDAQGRLIGTVVEEDATYTPPHLQRGGKGLFWLLVLFLLAPIAFPLIIFGLLVLGMLLAVLQKVLMTTLMVVAGLLVLLLLFRLVGRIPRRP